MKPTITTTGHLDINRFAEAMARALTVQYEKQYPGLQVTVKSVRRKDAGNGENQVCDNTDSIGDNCA